MNVLEKIKARLADGRVAELEARIEQMEEEHDKEILETSTRYENRIEIITGERDQARQCLASLSEELSRLDRMAERLVSK